MEPISTVGMTVDDVTTLSDRTRAIMLTEYEKLCVEIDEKKDEWAKKDFPRMTVNNIKGSKKD